MCGHPLLTKGAQHDHGDEPLAETLTPTEESPDEVEDEVVVQGSGLRAVRQLAAGGGGGGGADEEAEAADDVGASASQQMMLLLLTSQLQGRAQAEQLAQTIGNVRVARSARLVDERGFAQRRWRHRGWGAGDALGAPSRV
jgi:hypothetical protein